MRFDVFGDPQGRAANLQQQHGVGHGLPPYTPTQPCFRPLANGSSVQETRKISVKMESKRRLAACDCRTSLRGRGQTLYMGANAMRDSAITRWNLLFTKTFSSHTRPDASGSL
jgi:hypothetical protein